MAAGVANQSHAYWIHEYNDAIRAPEVADGDVVWRYLLILVDASGSQSKPFEEEHFFDIQVHAIAEALLSECPVVALTGEGRYRTAIAAVLWSSPRQQKIATHWRVIRPGEAGIGDLRWIGDRLKATPNSLATDTSVGGALRYALRELNASFIPDSAKRIINISANGRNNSGPEPLELKLVAEQLGVQINAVVMRGQDITVDEMYDYFRENVITNDGHGERVLGEGSALRALAQANTNKLCAEVAGAPPADLQFASKAR